LELKSPPITVENTVTDLEDNKTHGIFEKLVNDSNNQNDESNNLLDASPHPWRRLFARTADFFFGGYLMLIPISYAVGFFFPYRINDYVELFENPLIISFASYLIWIPLEALFISLTGTTPGKWVFGIKVLSKKLDKLSYSNALKRAFRVFYQGEGFSIPLITLFTRIYAYKRLKETGTTLWDTAVNSMVTYKKWGIIRILAAIFVYLIMLVILTILNSL